MVLLTMILTKYALLYSFITNSFLTHFEFSILTLSVLLITAGGYIINDIYDVEADRLNKPNKVFIDVIISKKNAWRSYFLLTFIGLFLSVFLSFYKDLSYFSFVFIFTSFGLFLYSKYLKKLPLLGNFIISVFIAFVIYLVYLYDFKYIEFWKLTHKEAENSVLFLHVWITVILYAAFSFLTTLIREIIKDIEDINGDLKIKAKTLPIIIGRKRASKVAFFFSAVLLLFLLIILQYIKKDRLLLIYGIVFILLPLLYFMCKLWFSKSKKAFSELSNLMKVIMLFGILSMLLFRCLD
ncbi:geranylgeranylglycerol-phosphate geranylgeranyltransferase [Polaribacter sp. Hel1_85]|uniref:geranylgeranylglycerol-phosphate geranylgeranyltransferase n=1 Tax=Polaribacter sp. Hel1_85 TaxID=1250005 RepID=UPI00052DFAB6|nr:geranylgeranylglycerol-phosphate geranylgeranyltransferase [Polaribacter sp. Hel1_85]KGL63596.1 UbiA family prenyltransferase [Polaribacter sp. Hel1_85]